MARTEAGQKLTELQRQQQLSLRADVLRQVLAQWKGWNLQDQASYEALQGALAAIAEAGANRSATLAGSYYQLFRLTDAPELAKQVAFEVMMAKPPSLEEVKAVVDSTAKTGIYNAFRAGKSYDESMANGLVKVSGGISRLVLNAGRDTILQTVRADKGAEGWARATSAQPCAFCAMLASRGPVYADDTVGFQAHDHCSCTAEPVYKGSEWPGKSEQYRELWQETGSLNAFRSELTKPTGE